MTQLESDIFTKVDTSDYVPTLTSVANEIGLVGNAYFKYDPNQDYSVLDILTAPPSSNSEGDKYIIGTTATGDWTGHDNEIATYTQGSWVFTTPTSGQTAFVIDEQTVYSFSTSWTTTNNPHSFVYDGTQNGKIWIITGDNFVTEVSKYIKTDVSSFISNDVSASKASYETKNSLVRALELIFKGNPNAIVRCIVIKDDSTDAENSITNLTEALDKLLAYDSIYYINVAGKIPLSAVQTHVTKASSNDYMAERIYIAGYDLANIMDNTYSYVSPNFTDMASKDEEGRTVVFAGNCLYTFNILNETNAKNIGGNWIAHYITGLLSSMTSSQTLTRKTFGLGKTVDFDGNDYVLDKTLRNTLANELINYVRRQYGNDFFEIFRTYSSESSAYIRLTTRRITDEVIRVTRINLSGYFGKLIDNVILNIAKTQISNALLSLASNRIIDQDFSIRVFTTPSDRINGVITANVTFKPMTYISYIYLTIKPVS